MVWPQPWKVTHLTIYCHASEHCAKSLNKTRLTQLRKRVDSFLSSLVRAGCVPTAGDGVPEAPATPGLVPAPAAPGSAGSGGQR